MEKEELLIKRLKEDIKKWDIKISENQVSAENAKGSKKNQYEKEIEELSEKISDARKEIKKLEKKMDDFSGSGKTESGEIKGRPIVPPRTGG